MSVGVVSKNVTQLAPSSVDGHVDAIRDAIRRGVFTDYETGLAKKGEWAYLLRTVAKGPHKSEERLQVLILYLFTVTIDPKFNERQRKAIVEKELEGLSDEDRDTFYLYFDYYYPPVMATHLLRYGALWRRTCQTEFCSNRADWVLEVIGNRWPFETRKEFVEQVFLSGGANRDRILERIIFRASDEELQAFGRVSNPIHVTRLQMLSGDLLGLCKYLCSYMEVQFIKWFKRKALEHPDASVVVAHFTAKHWSQLQGTPKLTSLVVRWMSEIGSHPKRPEHLGQFHQCGSAAINEAEITDVECRKLAQLTPIYLVSYIDEFKPALQNAVIQSILRDEPQKLVWWLELILTWSDKVVCRSNSVSNETALGKIIGLFALIERNRLLPRALSLVFNHQTRPALALTVYSAVDTNTRRKILAHLRGDSVRVLAEWKRLCASPESDLRAFVRDEFARDLEDRLAEIDPAAGSEKVDVKRKLISHFQNPAITPHERSHFLRGIRAELVKEENWLAKLIQDFPQPLLPFLYFYFIEDICASDYYKCEKPMVLEGDRSARGHSSGGFHS